MEVVENVEEHVLRLLLATEELHVVHDEDVRELIEVGEVVDTVVPHRVDELVRELLRVDVEDRLLREAVLDFNSDRVGEVGLSKTNRAVDEQRIEGCTAGFWATANPALRAKQLLSPSMKLSKLYFEFEVGVDVQLLKGGITKGFLIGASVASIGMRTDRFRTAALWDVGSLTV